MREGDGGGSCYEVVERGEHVRMFVHAAERAAQYERFSGDL